ncbi:tetratricopeptide repeat protein [Jiella pelagia]|nr:tetratricopeptide repeat protein [Jiella pelagia]
MQRAAQAMGKKDNAAAMDVLDQTLVLDPDYAEAWNRRATLNFGMDRWGKSLADIEQTLSREPRHWGAMMGLAMILERLDEDQKAFDTYMQVLAVYPALKSAQDAAGRLADKITGPVI